MNKEQNILTLKKAVELKRPVAILSPELHRTVTEFENAFPECDEPIDGIFIISISKMLDPNNISKYIEMIVTDNKTSYIVVFDKDSSSYRPASLFNKFIHLDFRDNTQDI